MNHTQILLRAAFAAACALAMQTAHAAYVLQDFTVAGATNPQLWGVNNDGVMVGSADFNGVTQAIVVNHGVASAFATPQGAVQTTAFGISDAGVAVVSYLDADTGSYRSMIGKDGALASFVLPGTDNVQLRGISADGRYVTGFYDNDDGTVGFVDDLTGGTGLHLIPNNVFSIVQGINSFGVAAGNRNITYDDPRDPFLYSVNSGAIEDFHQTGALAAAFRGINDQGIVAGWAELPSDNDFGYTEVALVGAPDALESFQFAGSWITTAQGINNSGLVVGTYENADGSLGAFYASAVPEPGGAALSLTGLLLMGWRTARRKAIA